MFSGFGGGAAGGGGGIWEIWFPELGGSRVRSTRADWVLLRTCTWQNQPEPEPTFCTLVPGNPLNPDLPSVRHNIKALALDLQTSLGVHAWPARHA